MSSGGGTPEDLALMERALRWTDGFVHWPSLSLSALLRRAVLLRASKGELLADDAVSDPLALVLVSGHVMVHQLRVDGSRLALGLVGPGRLANFSGIAQAADDWHCEFVAHDAVQAIALPSSALLGALDADPKLWIGMSRILLRQQGESFNSLVERMTGALRQRLAATIDRMATLYGVSERGGQSLRLRLSQVDIATLLQTSRQSVSKEMRALAADQVIGHDYGSITILDRIALRREAGKSHSADREPLSFAPASSDPGEGEP